MISRGIAFERIDGDRDAISDGRIIEDLLMHS
jgi:hypothetical protein